MGCAGSIVPRFGMKPLNKLGLRLHPICKVENVYYPPAIREAAPASSEAEIALEEAETAQPEVALAITAPNKQAKESELSGATETNEGSNPKAPQKTAKSAADAQASHAEESALSVQPLQTVPPNEGSKDGIRIKLKK